MPSKIGWTQETWNPVTGCTQISPGCAHCYAKDIAESWRGRGDSPYRGVGFDLTLRPERLDKPHHWRNPRVVFVNSMSDLYHEDIPVDYVQQVHDVMEATPRHTYQVLTKRPERALALAPELPWPANVWLGVSVENQRWTSRIDVLRRIQPALRFLSVEPLLGPVELDLDGIGWVICGGESGLNARRMMPEWARAVRDQTVAAGLPFFFKQWGTWSAGGRKLTKNVNGNTLDGETWEQMPDLPPGEPTDDPTAAQATLW